MKAKQKIKFEDLPKTYNGLANILMPRPIHDEIDLNNATEILDLIAGHKLNKEQDDYFDAVSTFIEKYEQEHSPLEIEKLSPIEALKYLLEQNEMTAADLSRLLKCDRTLGSKILNGERNLTADHISVLSDRFKVRADLFLS